MSFTNLQRDDCKGHNLVDETIPLFKILRGGREAQAALDSSYVMIIKTDEDIQVQLYCVPDEKVEPEDFTVMDYVSRHGYMFIQRKSKPRGWYRRISERFSPYLVKKTRMRTTRTTSKCMGKQSGVGRGGTSLLPQWFIPGGGGSVVSKVILLHLPFSSESVEIA